MNIDDVLAPYADDQPKQISMHSATDTIERIPLIVDSQGVTPAFQKFYDRLVTAIMSSDYDTLYEMSDKAMSREDFIFLYKIKIGLDLKEVLEVTSARRGIDIELNLGRFQKKHRNLIGGFYIIFYMLEQSKFSDLSQSELTLVEKYSEIKFTYKDGAFTILSNFRGFAVPED